MKALSHRRLLAFLASGLAAIGVSRAAIPFTNGSFEQPVFSSGVHSLPPGSTSVTGWVRGGSGVLAVVNGPGTFGLPPAEGAQHISFVGDGSGGVMTLSQEFLTAIGQTYTVSFQVALISAGSRDLLAEVTSGTGAVLGSLTAAASGGYGLPQSFTFIATTTNSTIKFSNASFLTGGVELYLDNVQVVAGTTGCLAPPSGLVSWWKGEGNAIDSGSTNDGTFVGAAAFGVGMVGQALSFGGANHVTVPASASLSVQSFTIETWIYPGDVGQLKPIVEYAAAGGMPGVHLWHSVPNDGSAGVSPGSLYANVGDIFGPYHFGTAGGVIPANEWTHVALTYDQTAGVARLFVNGVNLASTNLGSITPGTALPVNLGYRPMSGEHFVGKMDEVSIYNRALTTNEIQAVFNASSAGKCNPSIIAQPVGASLPVGADVTLSVEAVGTRPLIYQWRHDGTNIFGAGSASLLLTNLQLTDTGNYSVVVSNAVAAVTSSNAFVNVTPLVCFPVPTGLVSWWQGEMNTMDATGLNDAAFVNAAVYGPGKVGQAFSFEGTNYVSVPASSNLNVQSLTIDAWVNPSDISTAKPLVEFADPTGNPGVHLWLGVPANGGVGNTPGSLYANLGNVFGPYHFGTVGGIIPSNQWTHVALTFDKSSGIARLYVNGINQVSTNLGSLSPLTALPVNLGFRRPGERGGYYVGKMDEVSIYDRALSPSEILSIFYAGIEGKCPQPLSMQTQPQSRGVLPGASVTFGVTTSGTQPASYRWSLNGTNIVGATSSSITVTNAQLADAGEYRVAISNSVNSIVSDPATLKVVYLVVLGNGQVLTNTEYLFFNSVNVELKSQFTNGATFYTLDGSLPTFASTLYAGPFVLTQSAVVRAVAYSADFLQSWQSDPVTLTVVPTFTLTATTLGGGGISVAPSDGPYPSGSIVNITATPTNGWTFLGWTGDASGTNSTVAITMNRSKSVQATFGTTLGTTVAGNGSISLIPPGNLYPYGTVVRLYAVPEAGNYFALWGNAGSGSGNPLAFTLTNAGPTVSSLFATLGSGQFTLTVVPDGFGLVDVSPQTNRYGSGSLVTLTAVPNTNQQFLGWTGDATGTNNPLQVVMNQSKTIGASFTAQPTLSLLGDLDNLAVEGVTLTLVAEFGGHYRVDGSTNLPAWTPLATITNTFGSSQFTDESATNQPVRFYRAVSVP